MNGVKLISVILAIHYAVFLGANGKMRLGHKPCCGLLESNYYLPLRFAPLELEFTIVSDGNEPVVVPEGNGDN